MMKRLLPFLTFCVALSACVQEGERQAVDFIVPISAQEVRLGTVEDRIVATGTLRAPQVVTLVVETAGALQIADKEPGRRLAEGDRVQAGDVIARVTGEDVRLAVRREATQQRYQAAKLDLESSMSLYERGLISQKEIENLQASFEDAKLELERSVLTESRNQMVTPISGVILSLARNSDGQIMANGQLVSANQTVAQIAPTDVLIADIDLVGSDLARVEAGAGARVAYHAFGDRAFEGTLTRFAPTIDQRTRALRAEVEVDNSGNLLRPGMFVEVTLIVERREGVPVVPRDAVTVRAGERVVFVINGQRAVRRAVELGLGDDNIVEIVAGVQAGDRIVTSGLETLADQTRVREAGL